MALLLLLIWDGCGWVGQEGSVDIAQKCLIGYYAKMSYSTGGENLNNDSGYDIMVVYGAI